MKYIELPKGVKEFQVNEKGKYFFYYQSCSYFLDEIISLANKGQFTDATSKLVLSVTDNCPNQDKFYIEYLQTGHSNAWCQIHNGKDKNQTNFRILSDTTPWTNTSSFFALSTRRQEEKISLRQDQKEQRYSKDAKSW